MEAWVVAVLAAGGTAVGIHVFGIRSGAGQATAWALTAAIGILCLVRRTPRKIPVLNYHSVSEAPGWMRIAGRVSLPPALFERQLRYLKRKGYQTLFISEVRTMLAGETPVPPGKAVALTFDDGYADNWVAAYPLLRRHGAKATLFVSPDWIAETERRRPTLEDREAGRVRRLDWRGYLSWAELKAMREGGWVEIQPHGRSHDRVFTGPEVRGFCGPGKTNPWLMWTTEPGSRRTWWRDRGAIRRLYGHPVFRQGPALACRAYRPDPRAVGRQMAWAAGAGRTCFRRPDWERHAKAAWEQKASRNGAEGTCESAAEYAQRVSRELSEARRILSERTGAAANILCWPENAFSEDGEAIAGRLGFAATVSNRHDSRNAVGERPDRIMRVFVGSRAAGVECPALDFAAFVLELKVMEGWYGLYPPLAVLHLCRKLALAVGRRWGWKRDYQSIWE